MKKQLLSFMAALSVVTVTAQVPSPDWTNQQTTYTTATNPVAPGVDFLDVVDSNVIWTIGMDYGQVSRNYNWYSRTTDGGVTWTSGNVYPDTSTYVIANMEGVDANTAWVSAFKKTTPGSGGAIHRTIDGGLTWVNMTANGMYTNTTAFCNIVSFLTPSIGITQGDPVNGEFEIWRTTNGGLSWSQIPGSDIPDPLTVLGTTEYAIVDLYTKLGTSNIWFGTNKGRMYRSTNAGLTWSVAPVAANNFTLLEIAFTTPLLGITYASDGNTINVYNTFDGGATWSLITPVGNIGLSDVKGIPGTGMYASFSAFNNSQVMSYSSDNGLTWTDWGSTGIPYFVGDFSSPRHGWAGTWDDPNAVFTNLFEYTGPALSGTSAPTSAFTMPVSLCLSAATVTANVNNTSNGSPVLTYSWSATPATVLFSSSTASAPVLTFNAAGSYTIMLTVTNAFGANTSSQNITINSCTPPSPSFTLDAQGCTNLMVSLENTSTGGSPAPTYSWSTSAGGSFSPSPFAFEPTFMATTPGVYTISLTGSNDQGNVTTSHTVNVVSCAPAASFTMTDILLYCERAYSTVPKPRLMATNVTTVIPAVGPNSYVWSISPTSSVLVATYTSFNFTATIRHQSINVYTVTLKATNASGFSTVSHTVSVDLECVGIEENNGAQDIVVFPNPANDKITVKIPTSDNYSLKLVNVLGAVIYTENITKGTEEKTIDVSTMPKGVYFLTLDSNNGKGSRKLIIE